ncbi:AraC family transcriptional regulator [Hyalangium versicolor]|uniref:AraC family transcriptional regulator n=1 Tax=Hyalangium versicolor TaxID=2861190 RepID=UPI001CCA2CF6|nr:AraC family transcriptional regulator [Hyalangium versicolor]
MDALDDLRALIALYAGGQYRQTSLEGLKVISSDRPTLPMSGVTSPVLGMVAQGYKRTVLNDSVFTYGPGQYLVASLELPVTGYIVRASREVPFLGLSLALNPSVIAELLLEALPMERGAGQASAIGVSDASAELLDAFVRLLRLLDRPMDMPVLGPMIEREILWRLLSSRQGAMVRQIGLADSRLSQIGRAIRRIRTGYAENLRISELARLAGMSVTSFHRHFRAITSMSPLQYQKQIRLREARARLIAEAGDVASVGYAVGYESPSQFSREYRKLFGAPPGKDAARLQQASYEVTNFV